MVQVRVRVTGANVVAERFRQAAAALLGGGKATVGNTLPYAPFVHDGQRPHVIVPRVKKALWWEGAAHPVALVNHPGYGGSHYLDRAAAETQGAVDALFNARVRGVFTGGLGSAREWAYEAAEQIVLPRARELVNKRSGNLLADLHASRS